MSKRSSGNPRDRRASLRVVRGREDADPGPAAPPSQPALRSIPVAEPADPALVEIPLELLYERYAPYVAAIAMRIVGRESEVEDLVQDVFATAIRGLRTRRSHAEVKRWLATVTVRRSMRRLRLLALYSIFDLADVPAYDRIADPVAGVEERRLVAQVYRTLERIPIRERVAWVLRHVEGESLKDVAELCRCSLATAKRRIARAQVRIAAALEGSPGRGS